MSENLYPHSHRPGAVSQIIPTSDAERNEIIKGLSCRVHGVFASRKNARSLTWRTREEFDLLRLLEVDPNVLSYETLPEQIMIQDDGKMRSHYPAVRVTTSRKTLVLDAFQSLMSSGRQRLIQLLKASYAERGISYHAFSGVALRTKPRIDNARFILANRGFFPDLAVTMAIEAQIADAGQLSLAALNAKLPRCAEVVAAACAMTIDGSLRLDLSAASPLEMVASFARKGGLQ